MAYKNLSVGIVIPVYNSWNLVLKNVEQNLLFHAEIIDKIVLVNDSSPEPNPYVFPQVVEIIENSVNQGYTKTVNEGLKNINTDVIILLDSDAYPIEPYIFSIVDYYLENKTTGFIGLKTVDGERMDSGNFSFEPKVWELIVGQRLAFYLSRFKFQNNIIPYSCAISIRRDCFEEIGLLDEQFKFLDADFDYCMRIHRSKWGVEYLPHISVFHVGQGSIKANSSRVKMFYESRWKLLLKYDKIKFRVFVKYLIIFRLFVEYLLFIFLDGVLVKDKKKLKDKKKGRLDLISYCYFFY